MPRQESLRLVVDTNVWLSYLLTRSFHKFNTLVVRPGFMLLWSAPMIEELMDVLGRPRISSQVSSGGAIQLLDTIRGHGHEIEVTSTIRLCRDPNDDKVLEFCRDGRAHVLVTGDKDLLSLSEFEGTEILSPASFLRAYP